jgi:hypothetical protein
MRNRNLPVWIGASSITVGLIGFVASSQLASVSTFSDVLAGLAASAISLVVSMTMMVRSIYEYVDRKNVLVPLAGAYDRYAGEAGEIGLATILPDCSKYDYEPIVCDSRNLTIVLNDGRTWLSVHREMLRKRFSDARKTTTLFLIHPDSEFVTILARKSNSDEDAIRQKISESLQIISDIKGDATSIEVLGHRLFNPHSLVVGDNEAVITPYYISRGSRTIPAFVYSSSFNAAYFKEVSEDVSRLRMDSERLEIFEPNTKSRFGRVVRLMK